MTAGHDRHEPGRRRTLACPSRRTFERRLRAGRGEKPGVDTRRVARWPNVRYSYLSDTAGHACHTEAAHHGVVCRTGAPRRMDKLRYLADHSPRRYTRDPAMTDNLTTWLMQIGLGGHAAKVASQGIDWDVLAD